MGDRLSPPAAVNAYGSRLRECARPAAGGRVGWLLLIVALAMPLLAACAPQRHHEALLVLADAAAGEGPSRLKETTPSPRRQAIAFDLEGRVHSGDLYLPADAEPAAGIVLVPGVVPEGKDEPRLVAFATTLARARFAVLVPDLPGYRQLRIHPSDACIVADAFAYLAGRAELAPAGRAGLAAFSYGVGPALLAALEEDLRERVRFVVGVGGYHDLTDAARYLTTGYFRAEERWQYLAPEDYGKLVLMSTARSYVEAGDARVFDCMIERRLKDRAADLSDLAERLGPSGRAVYALAVNADRERFAALYAALPPAMRADMAALSLHDKDLTRLRARLILMHGRGDNLIPWPESAALAAAVPPSQARLYLLHSVLGHVDLRLSHVLSWRFLTRELPDIFRMWRAVDALVAEREAP